MKTEFLDALKSAFLVWLFTTIGLFVPGMLGWINEVTQWAQQQGAPPFPDPSNLAYLFIAATTAGFPAAVAGILRFIENVSGTRLLPRTAVAPVQSPERAARKRGERGAVSQVLALGIALAVIGLLVLFLTTIDVLGFLLLIVGAGLAVWGAVAPNRRL